MKKILIFLSFSLLVYCCIDEGRIDLIDSSDYIPLPVSVKEVKPLAGGAIVKYTLPDDLNLRGVRAEYQLKGETVFTQVSKYVDSLMVEGFSDTDEHIVSLFSLGKNNKLSKPVEVKVVPKLSATKKVSFILKETFGGIRLIMNGNEDNASLAITIIKDDNLDDFGKEPSEMKWEEVYTYYTSGSDVGYTRYGLDTLTRIYGVYARDRWMNYSDTVYFKLSPLREEYLENALWKIHTLPGDETVPLENKYLFKYMFDGAWDTNEHTAGFTRGGLRRVLTIDMGYTASLSRMRLYPRGTNAMTSHWTPWHWQIWGSIDPNPDGTFDGSWYLLGDFIQYKPSGYNPDGSLGTVTDEDNQYFFYNNDYEFVQTDQVMDPQRETRYIRLVLLRNYANYFKTFESFEDEPTNTYYLIGEMQMWGRKQSDN